jgi:anaerobic selenocysteine-containing dehydrogenase
MDRRNFFKIVSSMSAGAATVACSKQKSDALIPLLVPEHEIVHGEEQWQPSICTSCGAGCGVIVRVMRGERVIEKNGEKFREPIACVKKIEGNPLDSVSGGRLCASGHAALQSLYNPDRARGPMRRTGTRGKGEFAPISWDEAIAAASEKLAKVHASDPSRIVFLTAGLQGTRSRSIQRFLQSLGAPPASECSVMSLAVERKAAGEFFGWKGLPRYDLGLARYALGVGADFLGGWASPVYYARQYGHFRQGRPGMRGKLVQAESRMSITAASADEWLPLRPGAEPQFLIAVARLLIEGKLVRNAEAIPDGIRARLLLADVEALIRTTGLREKTLRRIVRELGESDAPLVIGGASVVHTNSMDAVMASHYVNSLLGNVGRPGGVLSPNELGSQTEAGSSLPEALRRARLVLLDEQNPVYAYSASSGVIDGLMNAESVISFGKFIDDSAAYADLVLPDHHGLESETAVLPPVSATSIAVSVGRPCVRPLHNTRAIEATLADLAKKVNVPFVPLTAEELVKPLLTEGETWDAVALQGGLWRDGDSEAAKVKSLMTELSWSTANFTGASDQFPFEFQPYVSLQYHDGRGANLPWMQELPDPASSSMWGLPVELDPKSAAELKIVTGDWVQVESPTGKLEAQAYVHPAAIPGVASMAIGEGHSTYGRYASGRGANPLSIVAKLEDAGATRVRVTRLDRKPVELIQFSPNDRDEGPWGYR